MASFEDELDRIVTRDEMHRLIDALSDEDNCFLLTWKPGAEQPYETRILAEWDGGVDGLIGLLTRYIHALCSAHVEDDEDEDGEN